VEHLARPCSPLSHSQLFNVAWRLNCSHALSQIDYISVCSLASWLSLQPWSRLDYNVVMTFGYNNNNKYCGPSIHFAQKLQFTADAQDVAPQLIRQWTICEPIYEHSCIGCYIAVCKRVYHSRTNHQYTDYWSTEHIRSNECGRTLKDYANFMLSDLGRMRVALYKSIMITPELYPGTTILPSVPNLYAQDAQDVAPQWNDALYGKKSITSPHTHAGR